MKSGIELNDEAVELYNQKNFEDALTLFHSAITLEANNAFIWKNLGDCQFDMNHVQEAYNSYEKSIFLDKNHTPNIYIDYAVILVHENEFQKALRFLLKAESHPKISDEDKSSLYIFLAEVYKNIQQYSQALRTLNRKKQLFPTHEKTPKEYFLYSAIFIENREYLNAVNILEKGIKQYPKNHEMYVKLTDIYNEYHLYGRIKKIYHKYNENIKENPDLIINFLIIRIQNNDYKDILSILLEHKQNISSKEHLEILFQIIKETEENLAKLNKFLITFDSDEDLHNSDIKTAQGYLKSIYSFFIHDFDRSLQFLLNILKSEKTNKLSIIVYGILMIFTQNYQKAINIFDIYIKVDTEFWLPHLFQAFAYYKLGDREKMRENLTELGNKNCYLDHYFDLENLFADEYIIDDLFAISTHYFREFT